MVVSQPFLRIKVAREKRGELVFLYISLLANVHASKLQVLFVYGIDWRKLGDQFNTTSRCTPWPHNVPLGCTRRYWCTANFDPGLSRSRFLKTSGADALAAVALVYPLVILAGMFSAGAFGGAVSGFTARAVGAGNYEEASTVLVCAVLISLIGGAGMWALVVLLGPILYQYASDSLTVTSAAQHYATLLFPVIPAYWLINMLSSVLRGSGDVIRPAIVAASLLASYTALAFLLIPGEEASLDHAIKAAARAMAGSYLLAAAILFLPSAVLGPVLRPPCKRHLLLLTNGNFSQGIPERALAPQSELVKAASFTGFCP